MESTSLFPALRELPAGSPLSGMSYNDTMRDILEMDRAMLGAEFATAISFGLWPLLVGTPLTDGTNVPDILFNAYSQRWPEMSQEMSLYDKWQELLETGEGIEHNGWFFSGLKGQLAEFETVGVFESHGFTEVQLVLTANNPGWDVSAINPDGEAVLIQVKTGTSLTGSEIEDLMQEDPEFLFALGGELHDKAVAYGIDTDGRVFELGQDIELVEGIDDGLDILSANMGIDIPDGVVDVVPYATVIVGGARLIYSFIRTERDFSEADRSTRNQIQVVQTLTLMSRVGISTVLATAGGTAGSIAGSVIPGVGNIVAGVTGTIAGAGAGMALNHKLRPRMLDIALSITDLTRDDLFYYKNKKKIDDLGTSFQSRATDLAPVA